MTKRRLFCPMCGWEHNVSSGCETVWCDPCGETFDVHVAEVCGRKTSPTLDDLASTQGVSPLEDMSTIVGTWPGEVDDGFEQAVDDLRKGKNE